MGGVRRPRSRNYSFGLGLLLLAALLGAALLGACSDGKTSTSSEFPTFSEPNLEDRILPRVVSIEEAERLASFEVRLPDASLGFEFLGGTYSPPIYGGSDGRPVDDVLEMLFSDGAQQVNIQQAATSLQIGGASDQIDVAGVVGQILRVGASTVHVSFTKDERSYIASTTLSETFTLEDLLVLLSSIS